MIYGKLPIVLLSALTSGKKDTINSQIAFYILNHLQEVRYMKITDLAKACHVANSSISRFCKEVGLTDFAELKKIIEENQLFFEKSMNNDDNQGVDHYCNQIIDSIQMAKNSIDMKKVIQLCKDIDNYQRISVFGLMKAMSAAISLQCDLLMQNKPIYTSLSYDQQIEYLKTVDKNDLIIIFSYTGSYFQYLNLREYESRIKFSKIWMIAGDNEKIPDFVDEVIQFKSLQNQASHPYQLQIVSSIIAQEYAYRHRS